MTTVTRLIQEEGNSWKLPEGRKKDWFFGKSKPGELRGGLQVRRQGNLFPPFVPSSIVPVGSQSSALLSTAGWCMWVCLIPWSQFPEASPASFPTDEDCLLSPNTGYWEDAKLELLAAVSPLPASSVISYLRETEGRVVPFLAGMFYILGYFVLGSCVIWYKTWNNHLEERRSLFMAPSLGISSAQLMGPIALGLVKGSIFWLEQAAELNCPLEGQEAKGLGSHTLLQGHSFSDIKTFQ